jgi:hypothetical protein
MILPPRFEGIEVEAWQAPLGGVDIPALFR